MKFMNEPLFPQKNESTPLSFEVSFKRLEEILEQLNSGSISLDDSLKLYAEADQLINACSSQLNDAEKTIEMLIKNRQGDIALDQNGRPIVQTFSV